MEYILSLLTPTDDPTLAGTLILYSFIIAAGILIGKIKLGGVSLGVTFVLFVGIVLGQIGYTVNPEVQKFLREFGLILFIFAIGLQVGPAFFSSFKKGGITLNMLAVLGVLLSVGIVLAIYFITGTPMDQLVGVMSGAVTNTPGLAAAQQAASAAHPDMVNTMSMGYAAAYPLGVIGIILSMFIVKWVFKIKVDDEIESLNRENENSQLKPELTTLEVSNERLDGISLLKLHEIIASDFIVSRLMDKEGNITIPVSSTQLHVGDKIYVVLSPKDVKKFTTIVGPEVDVNWDNVTPAEVVSRRIMLTNPHFNGATLSSLRLHQGYQLNCTRVNRAGVDLLAAPGLRLQMGDRITVVGQLRDIDRLAAKLGNSMKRLN
ncbi:MAG: transporter, partial [Muribaculaceae bacterium]|nr:transporter [Muribaculaceae bacterium]